MEKKLEKLEKFLNSCRREKNKRNKKSTMSPGKTKFANKTDGKQTGNLHKIRSKVSFRLRSSRGRDTGNAAKN